MPAIYKNGVVIIPHVELLRTPAQRMKGLLCLKSLPPGYAALLAPCNCIHTFFMRFPLDIAFLTATLQVIVVRRAVRPFRLVFGGFKAWAALEMESGWLPLDALSADETLELRQE